MTPSALPPRPVPAQPFVFNQPAAAGPSAAEREAAGKNELIRRLRRLREPFGLEWFTFVDAAAIFAREQRATLDLLRAETGISVARAQHIMRMLEVHEVVTTPEGSRRAVLVPKRWAPALSALAREEPA